MDYLETFAPVVKMNTIRILLSLVANYNWEQFDVDNVFLHGDLEEEIYMEVPPEFGSNLSTNNMRKLRKALYPGLKYRPSLVRLDRVVSTSNLSVPSPIPDTIFNTDPTKNPLNLVTSVEILSGLGRNYEFNRLKSKYSYIKPNFFFPFKS